MNQPTHWTKNHQTSPPKTKNSPSSPEKLQNTDRSLRNGRWISHVYQTEVCCLIRKVEIKNFSMLLNFRHFHPVAARRRRHRNLSSNFHLSLHPHCVKLSSSVSSAAQRFASWSKQNSSPVAGEFVFCMFKDGTVFGLVGKEKKRQLLQKARCSFQDIIRMYPLHWKRARLVPVGK